MKLTAPVPFNADEMTTQRPNPIDLIAAVIKNSPLSIRPDDAEYLADQIAAALAGVPEEPAHFTFGLRCDCPQCADV